MRFLALLALVLTACGGGDGGGQNNPPTGPLATADIRLLYMGNSHTSSNDLTGMVAEMVRAARPGKTVIFATITGASPAELPDFPQVSVDVGTQALLRAVATETVGAWPPRGWCPSDPVA